ncbi:MAG: hypothetical protein HN509_14980 [Halobacteriovoraceae bacterium]|jgi:hypothetical protein|nr:hypothetical protein [Halobacteriovoraceae bacterium]
MSYIAFVEFTQECQYLQEHCTQNGIPLQNVATFSPYPNVRRALTEAGFKSFDSLPYFNTIDHIECSQFVFDAIDRLDHGMSHIQDQSGNSIAYKNQMAFYGQFHLCYQTFLVRLLGNFFKQNSNYSKMLIFGPSELIPVFPMTSHRERPLVELKEELANRFDLEIEVITAPQPKYRDKNHLPLMKGILKQLTLFALKKFKNKKGLTIVTHEGAFPSMIKKYILPQKKLPIIYIAGGDNYIMDRGPAGWKISLGIIWSAFASFLGIVTGNRRFGLPLSLVSDLTVFIDKKQKLKGTGELLNHLEDDHQNLIFDKVALGAYWSKKFKQCILPSAERTCQLSSGLEKICEILKDSTFMSPHSLNLSSLMGEVCLRNNYNALLITHGSHVPPGSDFLHREFLLHGRNIFTGPYPTTAVQSKLADQYLDHYKIPSKRIKTGPILWGRKVTPQAGMRKHFKIPADANVILHASTQKQRLAFRLFLFETPDEFLDTILKLIEATLKLENTYLIIKFRPTEYCKEEDLKKILPDSERIIVSKEESFLEVLSISDILVSFSSTTIEEAIEYKKDVYLFGGRERLSFIPLPKERPEGRHAVNFLKEDGLVEQLDNAFKNIRNNPYPEEERNQLIISEDQRTPLIDFLN